MSRRVVVTGMGLVSPVGTSTEESLNNLVNGMSGVAEITLFDASSFEIRIAAEVKNFNFRNYVSRDEIGDEPAERRTQFGLAAAKMAVRDSSLDFSATRGAVVAAAGLPIVRLEDVSRWTEDVDCIRSKSICT